MDFDEAQMTKWMIDSPGRHAPEIRQQVDVAFTPELENPQPQAYFADKQVEYAVLQLTNGRMDADTGWHNLEAAVVAYAETPPDPGMQAEMVRLPRAHMIGRYMRAAGLSARIDEVRELFLQTYDVAQLSPRPSETVSPAEAPTATENPEGVPSLAERLGSALERARAYLARRSSREEPEGHWNSAGD